MLVFGIILCFFFFTLQHFVRSLAPTHCFLLYLTLNHLFTEMTLYFELGSVKVPYIELETFIHKHTQTYETEIHAVEQQKLGRKLTTAEVKALKKQVLLTIFPEDLSKKHM